MKKEKQEPKLKISLKSSSMERFTIMGGNSQYSGTCGGQRCCCGGPPQ